MRRPRSARDRSDMLGSELIVRTLARHGVTTIFSLCGNQITPLYDACIDARIRIVHVCHEAAAVFMAEHSLPTIEGPPQGNHDPSRRLPGPAAHVQRAHGSRPPRWRWRLRQLADSVAPEPDHS